MHDHGQAAQDRTQLLTLRTSSASGVGVDKDSDNRQRQAIGAFARRAGFLITGEFYDAAVSGTEPLEARAGFRPSSTALKAMAYAP